MSLKPWNTLEESEILSEAFLSETLGILFEPSDILTSKLVPDLLAAYRTASSSSPSSYTKLVDDAISAINQWDNLSRSAFIAGHPRIGEVSNLSSLSEAEQASKRTPPEVLLRLGYLNGVYEKSYPGLRYITFVNGRTREQIVPAMEALLEIQPEEEAEAAIYLPDSEQWKGELDRAVEDVGLIAKARLRGLGLE